MICYDCAAKDKEKPAVGVCRVCGRAVCMAHSNLQHTPQRMAVGPGMAPQMGRCRFDLPRLVCTECRRATECCPEGGRRAG